MKIPTYEKAIQAWTDGTFDPLELFVYDNEPAGDEDQKWRESLQNVVNYVSAIPEFTYDGNAQTIGQSQVTGELVVVVLTPEGTIEQSQDDEYVPKPDHIAGRIAFADAASVSKMIQICSQLLTNHLERN